MGEGRNQTHRCPNTCYEVSFSFDQISRHYNELLFDKEHTVKTLSQKNISTTKQPKKERRTKGDKVVEASKTTLFDQILHTHPQADFCTYKKYISPLVPP